MNLRKTADGKILVLEEHHVVYDYLSCLILVSTAFASARGIEPFIFTAMAHKNPNAMLYQDFINLKQIAKGGFSTVFIGKHKKRDCQMVLKKLDTDRVPNADFVKELEMHTSLRHPSVINVHGYIVKPPCIVLEIADYGSVMNLKSRLHPNVIPLSLVVRMIDQVVQGMHFLHSHEPSILHLDLKGDNVLVMENFSVKITDFGLSEHRQYATQDTVDLLCLPGTNLKGTLTHIPPEKFNSPGATPGRKFDVYSFAVFVYELLSDRRAFEGLGLVEILTCVLGKKRPDTTRVRSDTPASIWIIMVRCWRHAYQERPNFSDFKGTTEQELIRHSSRIGEDERKLKARIEARPGNEGQLANFFRILENLLRPDMP